MKKCPDCGSDNIFDHEDEHGEPFEDEFGNFYLECGECGEIEIVDNFEEPKS